MLMVSKSESCCSGLSLQVEKEKYDEEDKKKQEEEAVS